MFQHLQDEGVFYFIKSLFKINFEDHYLFLGMVVEVEELKSPS